MNTKVYRSWEQLVRRVLRFTPPKFIFLHKILVSVESTNQPDDNSSTPWVGTAVTLLDRCDDDYL